MMSDNGRYSGEEGCEGGLGGRGRVSYWLMEEQGRQLRLGKG